MDLCLKQWRDQQHESGSDHHHQQHHASALPLFATDHDNNEPTTKLITDLSAFPPPTRLPRMGSYLSLGQRQELEVQALIYRHMLAGAAVPPQLLHLLNKTLLLNSQSPPPYYLPQPHYHHPPLVESGYWGRGAMDPEPGRCRRTDGKKWRCSRDVVGGHKYCDRHMHRGRNRSRKPVEITKPTNNSPMPVAVGGSGTSFDLSGPSPSFDILHLHQRPSESIYQNKDVLRNQGELCEDDKSSGRILRHFFDDWPTSVQQHENASSATTSLSISVSGNTPSDFSLKLSTGNGDDEAQQGNAGQGQGRGQLNWGGGSASWGTNQVGGPLAEALRSSSTTSNSSPTSVLHQMQRGPSASEASYITT